MHQANGDIKWMEIYQIVDIGIVMIYTEVCAFNKRKEICRKYIFVFVLNVKWVTLRAFKSCQSVNFIKNFEQICSNNSNLYASGKQNATSMCAQSSKFPPSFKSHLKTVRFFFSVIFLVFPLKLAFGFVIFFI